MTPLANWSTRAINLPDHADNLIHTDEGARAAGFERALVAGTTVYAYMTHPPVEAWGDRWLTGGGGELRLRRPVFDDDQVDCLVGEDDDGPTVRATVGGDIRASLALWNDVAAPAVRDGDPLRPITAELTEAMASYGTRCGDDLAVYDDQGIGHPALWPNLANALFIENLVTGPWIHTRSRIYHEGVAAVGETLVVTGNLVERFDSRAGERALVDLRIVGDSGPIVTIEHEAIIVLP